MSDPEELKRFDALLDTTVRASRLSGSKVQELIKLSVQLVEADSHIVTTFFKLNRSLDAASPQRISSLYVFDAIAREARKLVDKGVGRDVRGSGGKGTQASLLLKMEGVVDSWVEGLLGDGKGGVWIEGKEKTRKIVDIWTKTSTFPQNTLDRLALKIANAQPRSTTPPYPPPLSVMSPALPPLDLPGNMTPLAQNGEGSTPSALPQTQTTQPGQLPPELRKLLGLPDETTSIPSPAANNAGPSTSTSAAAAPAVAALPGLPPEIAALLAKTRQTTNPTSASASAPGQPVPPATQGTQVAGLNLDLAQLAALTRLASASTSNTAASPPIPPHVPAPGPALNLPPRPAGSFHPQQQDPRPPLGHPSLPHPPPPHVQHDQRYNGPPRRTYDERDRSPQRRPPLGGSGDRRQSGDRSRSPTKGFPGPASTAGGGSGGRYPDRGPDRYDERPGPPGPPRMGFEPYTQQQRGDRAWSGTGTGPVPVPAGPPNHHHHNNNNNTGGRRRSHEFQPLPQKPSPSGGSGAGPTGRVPLPRLPSEGKDEFGRDILPPRPTLAAPTTTGQNDGEEDMALDDEDDQATPASAAVSLPPPPPSAGLPTRPVLPAQAAPTGVVRPPGVPARPPPVNTSAPTFGGQPGSYGRPPPPAPVSAPAGPALGSGGLDTFDISTFNPASPEAWTALAKAFENSMGRQPNQMEMMAFLMGGGGGAAAAGGGGGGGGGQGMPPGPNQGPGMGTGMRNSSMSSFGGGGYPGPAARGRF